MADLQSFEDFYFQNKKKEVPPKPTAVSPTPPPGFEDFYFKNKPMILEEEKKGRSLGEKIVYGLQDVTEGAKKAVRGVQEGVTSAVTSLPGGIVGLAGTIGKGLFDIWKTGGRGVSIEDAEKFGGEIGKVLTYQPQTPVGQKVAGVLTSPFAVVGGAVDVAAQQVSDPERQAAIRVGGNLLLTGLLFKLGHKLLNGRPVSGTELKLAARDVPNLPEEVWREIEKVPDQAQMTAPIEQIARVKEAIAPKQNIYRFIPADAPDIWRKVMDVTNGQGIRPYKVAGKAAKTEEYLSIPRPLRNAKSSYTMDIVADSLGLKTESALTDALQWDRIKSRKAIKTGEIPPGIEEIPDEIAKIRQDLLAATKMPSDKIAEFEMNTFMDGEKVLAISNEVKTGKKTKAAAVAEIKQLVKDTTELAVEKPTRTRTVPATTGEGSIAFFKSLSDNKLEEYVMNSWPGAKEVLRQREELRPSHFPERTKTPMSKTVAPAREADTQARMTVLNEKIATGKPLTESDKEFARVQGIYEEAPAAVESAEKVGSSFDRGIVNPPKAPGMGGGPEAGGLLYGMKLPKFAENINLEKVITKEPTLQDAGAEAYGVKQTILELTELHQQRIRNAREAGGRTWEQEAGVAKAIADKMGIEDIAAKFGVKADRLPGFVYACKETVVKLAEDFNKVRAEYVANPTDENLIRLKIAIEKGGSMLSDISSGIANVGRSLGIMRKVYRSQEYLKSKNYKAALDVLGGREITEKMAKMLATIDFEDPVKVVKLLRDLQKATTPEKITWVWKMFLLSAIPTQARNITGNFMMLIEKPILTGLTATAEIPRSIVTRTPREATYGQAMAELFGIWKGIPEGTRRMLFAWKNQISTGQASKIEVGFAKPIKGWPGTLIGTPGRFLVSADEFFKGIISTSDLYGQAWKQAGRDLKAGKITRSGFKDRVAEILSEPPEEMVKHATGEALYRTFQDALGKRGKAYINLKRNMPELEAITPFVQVLIKLTKAGLERTPMNLPRVIYKIIKGDFKGEQASTELAKVGLGTMTAITTFIAAREGKITGGGPRDPAQRRVWLQTHKPYAVQLFGKSWPYGWAEPASTVIGLIADFAELTEKMHPGEKRDFVGKIGQSITKNIGNKTFMQGALNFANMTSDPVRYGEKWLQNYARSVIPNLIGSIADSADPLLRDARNILDTVELRIPFLSKTNLPKRDIYGKPIEKPGTWLTRLISPLNPSPIAGTDVDKELSRLRIGIGLIDNKIKDRELTKNEYDELLQVTGGRIETVLGNLIKSAAYKNAPDDQRREDMIDYAVRKARELGRTEFMLRNLRKKQ
jgi:hypothetical protein